MGSKLNFPFQKKHPGEQPKNCKWCILMLVDLKRCHPWKRMQAMFTSSLHHIIHNKMESWRGKIERFWRWQDAFYMKKIYLKNWNYKYSSIFSKQIANKSVTEVDPFQSLVWVSTCKTWSLHLRSQGEVLNFDLVSTGIWILKFNIGLESCTKSATSKYFLVFIWSKFSFYFIGSSSSSIKCVRWAQKYILWQRSQINKWERLRKCTKLTSKQSQFNQRRNRVHSLHPISSCLSKVDTSQIKVFQGREARKPIYIRNPTVLTTLSGMWPCKEIKMSQVGQISKMRRNHSTECCSMEIEVCQFFKRAYETWDWNLLEIVHTQVQVIQIFQVK